VRNSVPLLGGIDLHIEVPRVLRKA
jgi:magnesium chelatase family protein